MFGLLTSPDEKGFAAMCEYCGCQELQAVAELTAEHNRVVELAGQARRAVGRDDLDLAAERARAITAVLGIHTAVEERALFPALAAEFGEHVERLVDDHHRIEAVLGEASTGRPADPAWPDRLLHALTELREHILREEDGLFPAALISLDPAQWESLARVRAAGVPVPRRPTRWAAQTVKGHSARDDAVRRTDRVVPATSTGQRNTS
jgi:hemerythrin superfamily protein